ncbi:MAG: hypothetical protein ACP5EP_09655 [Acidobacteriaceae bacterium]
MRKLCLTLTLCAGLAGASAVHVQAQTVTTHTIAVGQVEKIATALHHISIISLPEPVRSAAIGSDMVQMQWNGNQVLIEPLQEGVDTDLFVFIGHSSLTYEILPAGDPAKISYMVREIYPPLPPPPPGPSLEERQRERDGLLGAILMTTTPIRAHKLNDKHQDIQVRIVNVSEDAHNYYVRLQALNRGGHAYRIQTPVVSKIDPAFGSNLAYEMVDQQISQHTFERFRLYNERALFTHGSTLVKQDMQPGESTQWIMAIDKPNVTPRMYQFKFPDNAGNMVRAIAIF